MKLRTCWIAPFLLISALRATPAQGAGTVTPAPTVTIGDQPSCAACTIELTPVVTLGDRDGGGLLYQQSTLATDSRGRYYVSANMDPAIVVFDAKGRFLQKIGKRGQGPGEFRDRPFIYFSAGDTLYAADIGRITVFAPDYRLVRTIPLETSGSSIAFIKSGTFVVAGTSRSRDLIGFPMHLVSADGKVIRSFGSESGRQDLGAPQTGLRSVAPASGDRVWSADPYAYVLERWNPRGARDLTVRREAPWFPPNLPSRGTPRRERPPPRLRAVQEEPDGTLLALARVPDRDWKLHPPSRVGPGGATYTSDSLLHKLYDSVIEVLDPAKRTLLVRKVFRENFVGFIGPRLLASYTEDEEGNPRYVVWRLRVIVPT